MRSSQTRRRMLALAALTSVAVVTGSIAVADAPNADDIAADALASSPELDPALPTDVDVDEVVSLARTVREPLVAPRLEALATDAPTTSATDDAASDDAAVVEDAPAVAATSSPEDEVPADDEAAATADTTWVASWYGPGFHGNLTANGEVYDQWGLTAAHKTLPFGTELRVTNPRTGESVLVRITDRGPFIPGRDIDLSRGAAEAIGVRGVAEVEIEFV